MSNHDDVFQPVIPWQCIPDVLAIFKSRDYSRENTGKLLMHCGWFMGCTGRVFADVEPTPEPTPEPVDHWLFGQTPISACEDDALEAELLSLYNATAAEGIGSVDWKKLWEIAGPILLELLKRWLEKSK